MLRSLFFLPSARRSEILQGFFLVERCRRRMDPAAKANKKKQERGDKQELPTRKELWSHGDTGCEHRRLSATPWTRVCVPEARLTTAAPESSRVETTSRAFRASTIRWLLFRRFFTALFFRVIDTLKRCRCHCGDMHSNPTCLRFV